MMWGLSFCCSPGSASSLSSQSQWALRNSLSQLPHFVRETIKIERGKMIFFKVTHLNVADPSSSHFSLTTTGSGLCPGLSPCHTTRTHLASYLGLPQYVVTALANRHTPRPGPTRPLPCCAACPTSLGFINLANIQ